MNTTTMLGESELINPSVKADRVGVMASVLCAIHCVMAPVLLLALPSFGRVWAHPASHVMMALLVVPLACYSIRKGYRVHRKRWVVMLTGIGILGVLVGAALPALLDEDAGVESVSANEVVTAGFGLEGACSGCGECGGCESAADESIPAEAEVCVDGCCPSILTDASGETSLHVPPAAVVTTLGGLFLIAAHVGNLCFCGHACRTRECAGCE